MTHCEKDGIYETAKVYIQKGNCQNSTIIEMVNNGSEENQDVIVEWFKKVLKGKIGYIKQVKGENNPVFLKYAKMLNDVFEEEIFHIDNKIELLKIIEKSVFVLESTTDNNYVQGSGFIAKGIGLLTNFHVTEDDGMYTVRTYKNKQITSVSNSINLKKYNSDIDYACYRFGAESEDALEVGTSKELTIGSRVLVAGYPEYIKGNSPEIQNVSITSERPFLGQRIYTISGRIVHGASGGVVLDESNKVVGIIRCGPVTFKEAENSAVQGIIPIDDVINDLKV